MILQHTDEQMEECSCLETERAQRTGDSFSKDRQSAGSVLGKNPVENARNQMQILKFMLKGLILQRD